jgi:hypothetical protein
VFGCFARSHYMGSAGSYLPTDGAACLDATHGVFVTSSYDSANAQDPGILFAFDILNADLDMAHLIPSDGGNLAAGGWPIAALCH